MTVKIIAGAPTSGKTQWLVDQIQEMRKAGGLPDIRVILPEQRQKSQFQKRLIAAGGMLGVRISTFTEFCRDLLLQTGAFFPQASLPLKHRVLLNSIDAVDRQNNLGEFGALRGMPGFAGLLHALFRELQQAGVDASDETLKPWKQSDGQINALLEIYRAYQQGLESLSWLDGNFLIQFTVDYLKNQPRLAAGPQLLIIDGFERFTPSQLGLLSLCAQQYSSLMISLPLQPGSTRVVYHRPGQTLEILQKVFPALQTVHISKSGLIPAAMQNLADYFYCTEVEASDTGGVVRLLAVQSPSQEVRESLRWIKQKWTDLSAAVGRANPPKLSEFALVTPNTDTYRPLLKATAEEFGIPLRFSQPEILAEHPAISLLRELLNLHPQNFPSSALIDILRSPYLDLTTFGFSGADAIKLEMLRRSKVIISTLERWQAVLEQLARTPAPESGDMEDEEEGETSDFALPNPEEAVRLWDALQHFAALIQPPQGFLPLSGWLDWLESCLERSGWIAKVHESGQECVIGDLGSVLQGLRLTEIELGVWNLDYAGFTDELNALLRISDASEPEPSKDALQVLRVPEIRGRRFAYVAVLGLAEGSLPAVEHPDPFLPGDFRRAFGLESRLDQDQVAQFFQLLTRANNEIHFTRPYLTAKGESLPPSPYWTALLEILGKDAETTIRPSQPRALEEAASLSEVLFWSSQNAYPLAEDSPDFVLQAWKRLQQQKAVLKSRTRKFAFDDFEGAFAFNPARLDQMTRPEHVWSVTRLETYLACPLWFWVSYGLNVSEQPAPMPGLQAWQAGSILHEILEKAYLMADNPNDPESVLPALEKAAAEVFTAAPEEYQFEPHALWQQQQREWLECLKDAVRGLSSADWQPLAHEQHFGLYGQAAFSFDLGDGRSLRLHGKIDRIDRNREGQIRIIDYKMGSSKLANKDLAQGSRLQLPVYAMAAQEALGYGQTVDGFYWAILARKAGALSLGSFEYEAFQGLPGAVAIAQQYLSAALEGIQRADYHPQKPEGGCPAYCAARLWCWRYSPGSAR